MSSETKRLGKIAREFNVGISTIVEFLNKKGFEVTSNPNSKITDDVYSLLQKEYSRDIVLKKESEKINLRVHRHQKNESLTIDDVSKGNDSDEEEPDEDIVRITDNSSKQHINIQSSHKPEKNVDEKPFRNDVKLESDLKVVGKIDLNSLGRKASEPVQSQEPKKEAQPVKTEQPIPAEFKEKVETPAPTPISTEPEKVRIPEEVKAPVNEIVEVKKQEQIVEAKSELKKELEVSQKEVAPEQVKKETSEHHARKEHHVKEVKPAPTKVENIESESTHVETHAIEEIKTNVVKVESDIKVVGRIDLSSLNQRTRPPKKSKKQREDERKAREFPRKANVQSSTPTEENNSNEISHKQVRVEGPTVVGKIDLPNEKTAAEKTAAEKAQAKKRKRKRISKERVNVEKPATEGKTPLGLVKKDSTPLGIVKRSELKLRKKPATTSHSPSTRRPVRAEVSEEDVQKQIKDTLLRLTTKTKSKGAKHRRDKRAANTERMAQEEAQALIDKNILQVTEFVSVNELASMMDVPPTQVISSCMSLGLFVSINQRLDAETMSLVAEEFGFKVEFISVEVQEAIIEEEDQPEELVSRPPIVTVMGHVDHGKTSLLDYIRSANVIAGEAGGITQHIGAYNVTLENGKKITFLDTPGHEAFTAMRARGAQVTDIAIIIVAADDNVMPQTTEAINHAQAAGVPIIFAINKVDKPGANPEAIKERLAGMNFLVEDWGGKYQSQDISAKHGQGVSELLEKILLEAEMLDLKANPNKKAIGSVVESTLDKGRGFVATVLVSAGTLKVGDIVIAGPNFGHVKAMFNERNQKITHAGPSEPALILGLNGAPQAGDKFNVIENEREARSIANKREQLQREQGLRTQKHITLEEIGRRIAIGNFQELNVIVKADVDGSIEALADSLIKLSTQEIQVNVIHKAVGQISESDVMLAAASNAIIIGFQVRPSLSARKLAEKEQIDIRLYSVIYDAIEQLKSAMEGMLSPEIKEEITGTAEVLEVYDITKVGTVAGCIIRDGKIARSNRVRLIRDGIVVYTGELASLKRFKEDAKEVLRGYECGMGITNYRDIKTGDFIEAFKEVEVAKHL